MSELLDTKSDAEIEEIYSRASLDDLQSMLIQEKSINRRRLLRKVMRIKQTDVIAFSKPIENINEIHLRNNISAKSNVNDLDKPQIRTKGEESKLEKLKIELDNTVDLVKRKQLRKEIHDLEEQNSGLTKQVNNSNQTVPCLNPGLLDKVEVKDTKSQNMSGALSIIQKENDLVNKEKQEAFDDISKHSLKSQIYTIENNEPKGSAEVVDKDMTKYQMKSDRIETSGKTTINSPPKAEVTENKSPPTQKVLKPNSPVQSPPNDTDRRKMNFTPEAEITDNKSTTNFTQKILKPVSPVQSQPKDIDRHKMNFTPKTEATDNKSTTNFSQKILKPVSLVQSEPKDIDKHKTNFIPKAEATDNKSTTNFTQKILKPVSPVQSQPKDIDRHKMNFTPKTEATDNKSTTNFSQKILKPVSPVQSEPKDIGSPTMNFISKAGVTDSKSTSSSTQKVLKPVSPVQSQLKNTDKPTMNFTSKVEASDSKSNSNFTQKVLKPVSPIQSQPKDMGKTKTISELPQTSTTGKNILRVQSVRERFETPKIELTNNNNASNSNKKPSSPISTSVTPTKLLPESSSTTPGKSISRVQSVKEKFETPTSQKKPEVTKKNSNEELYNLVHASLKMDAEPKQSSQKTETNDANSLPVPEQRVRKTSDKSLLRFKGLNAHGSSKTVLKEVLLKWIQKNTTEYQNVQIVNYSKSWADGLAFCALIHHFYPNSFDYSVLSSRNPLTNFKLAFETAKKYAGIEPLIDPEDMMALDTPDEKCVYTYVQFMYNALKKHPRNMCKRSSNLST